MAFFWNFLNCISCISGLGFLPIRSSDGQVTRLKSSLLIVLLTTVQLTLSLMNMLLAILHFKNISLSALGTTTNLFELVQMAFAFLCLSYGLYYKSELRKLQIELFKNENLPKLTSFHSIFVMLYFVSILPIIGIVLLSRQYISTDIPIFSTLRIQNLFHSFLLVMLYAFIFESYVTYYENEFQRHYQNFSHKLLKFNDLEINNQRCQEWRQISFDLHKLSNYVSRVFKFFGPIIVMSLVYYFIATIITLYSLFTFHGFINFLYNLYTSLTSLLPIIYLTNRSTTINLMVSIYILN